MDLSFRTSSISIELSSSTTIDLLAGQQNASSRRELRGRQRVFVELLEEQSMSRVV